MHDTKVKMKDGRIFCGPLWMWRPLEGWFSLGGEDVGADKIMLRDVEEAVTEGPRTSVSGGTADRDELQRARKEGWDGT